MAVSRQKAIDPTKVAVYIRWSTDDQGEGTTLEVQMDGCRHYILSQGWAFCDDLVFVDEGYSGGNLDRPAITKLRAAVQGGKVDCVVVFKLDRLSRSVVDTVRLVLEEWEGLCYVKSAREPIDTANHAGKMFFYMLVSYAEWERAVIRERTFSGKLKRAEEGRNPGMSAPYGYKQGAQQGTFEIDEEEAAVVSRIFQMYCQGAGVKTIAFRLNDEGVRFRGNRFWNQSTVQKMIRNPFYCGDLLYGRRTINPNRGKRKGEPLYLMQEPHVASLGAVPAIIPKEKWIAIQAIRASRPGADKGTSGRAFSSPHLLTSIAKCRCGHSIISYQPGNYPGWYYRCMGQRKKGPAVCQCGYIPKGPVDNMILEKLQQEFGSQLAQQRFYAGLRRQDEERLRTAREGLVTTRRELVKLEEAEARVRKLLRDGAISAEDYREQREDIGKEATTLRDQVDRLERVIKDVEASLALQDQQREMGDRIREIHKLPVDQQKQILRHFVESLTLYRDKGSEEIFCDVRWQWAADRGGETAEVLTSES